MAEVAIARLFKNGRSQAVRLPQEFRFQGDRVRLRRVTDGVLIQPILDIQAWFAEMDREAVGLFMEDRVQVDIPIGDPASH